MIVIDRIVSYLDGLSRSTSSGYGLPVTQVGNPDAATQRDTYAMLRSLYYANSTYSDLAQRGFRADEKMASTKELRMLAHAVVEAFVALVMPGDLPDALPMQFDEGNARADDVRDRIHDVWTWSNWAQKKQLYVRQQSMLGNAFIYVATRENLDGNADRVYFHLPEPEHVTDLDTDERGFLTYIRTDVPVTDRERPDDPYVETMIWWKDKDRFQRWETPVKDYGDGKHLGSPAPENDKAMRSDIGIDFVPFVHAKAIDTGDTYGMAWIIPALEKQHEVNRKATAFSQQLYRHGKPDMVLQGSGGQTNGVFAPPPPIPKNTTSGNIDVAGETMWTVPPGWTIGHLIANVNYDAHMKGIDQDIEHIVATDLPILNWYRLAQSGRDTSGRALQTLLKPAIAQVEEARGNAETALARANAMALTIGQHAGLNGFDAATIGTYEDGSYDHQFTARAVIPAGEDEQGEIALARVQRVQAWTNAGMSLESAMRLEGFTDEHIEQATAITSGIER